MGFCFMIFIDTTLLNVEGWCYKVSIQGKNAFYFIININLSYVFSHIQLYKLIILIILNNNK